MRVLCLPRYGREAASSRQRFFRVVPYLETAGLDCVVAPFFAQDYLVHRFEKRLSALPSIVSSYCRRLCVIKNSPSFDVLFVQTELFPYLPTAFERRLLSRGIPCVYDYDDAWFHRYDGHANRVLRVLLRNKIPSLIERAAGVIVGSTYLAQYMRPFNRNVNLIPTCIDLECYPSAPLPLRPDPFFTIGWIGSPSTTLFLREVEGALAQFCSRHEARIVLIGASQEPLHIPNLTRLPWTEETEVEAISQFDVGIMPLSDTPFNRGKCAFKLIQYMGCWKPVIASPVGENVRVVEHGSNGFLAASPSEWMDALERLYADSALRQTMGRVGRGKIEREYSLQVMAPRVAEILRCVVQAQRR